MRNYKKEIEWRKNRYDEIRGFIPKDLGEIFRNKLQKENKTISSWLVETVEKYILTDISKNN